MLEQTLLIPMLDSQKRYRAPSEEMVELGWSSSESSSAPFVFGMDLAFVSLALVVDLLQGYSLP